MARTLTFLINEERINASLTKVDRAKLYGHREILPMDVENKPLQKAYLDEWGTVVIEQTGSGYMDADRNWCTREELTPVDAYGDELVMQPSSFDHPVPLKDRMRLDRLAEYEITAVYKLDGMHIPALAEKLGAYDGLFIFEFNYRAGHSPKKAFLNPVGQDVFMMLGNRAELTFLERPQVSQLDHREDESGDDDLDFDMM